MSEEIQADVISLTLPPEDRMNEIIHLTTSAVAGRSGLTIDQADDLNTALDEISRLSQENEKCSDAEMFIKYCIYPDRLEIIADVSCLSPEDVTSEINRFSSFIFENVCDRFEDQSANRDGMKIKFIKYIQR